MKKINMGFYTAAFVSSVLGVVACSSESPVTPGSDGGISTRQCTTKADCDNLGGEFIGRVCSQDGLCVLDKDAGVTTGEEPGCVSHEQCTADKGFPSRCPSPGAKCIQLGNENCEVIGDYKAENRFTIGVATRLGGSDLTWSTVGQFDTKSTRMALEELSAGLPSGILGKKVVGVICRSEGGFDTASHLLSVVDADLLLQSHAGDTVEVARRMKEGARPRPTINFHGTMSIRDYAGPAVAQDAVFQRIGPLASSAPLYAKLVSDYEAKWRESNTGDFRVTVIYYAGIYGDDLSSALFSKVRFNNKSAAENGSNYVSVARVENENGASWSAKLQQITNSNPHLVIMYGGDEMTRSALPFIESNAGVVRPRYLLHAAAGYQFYPAVAGLNADLVSRTRVVDTPFIPATGALDFGTYTNWIRRYYDRYPNTSLTEAPFFWSYETVYIGAWAAAASRTSQRVTPADFTTGLGRILDPAGTKTAVGVGSMLGINDIAAAGTVNLVGILSSFGIDVQKGRPDLGMVATSECGSLASGAASFSQNSRVFVIGPDIFAGDDACPFQ